MKGKRIIGLACALFVLTASAQTDFEKYKEQAKKAFDDFKSEAQKEYNDFRDKANADFAAFMEEPWKPLKVEPPMPVPQLPDPVTPPVKPEDDDDDERDNIPVPFEEVIPKPVPKPAPEPIVPIPEPPVEPQKPQFSFLFYNTPCKVRLGKEHNFSLSSPTEKEVSKVWKQLAEPKYNSVLNDCLHAREEMKLCDWAYIDFLRKMTEAFWGSHTSNESIVLQFYILTQSGYKVRIARADKRLVLLVPSNYSIFEYSYLQIDGLKYFFFDKTLKGSSFYVFDQSFPQEQLLSIQIYEKPKLAVELTPKRTLFSKRYPQLKVEVRTNKNLIDFYDGYPLNSNWDTYSKASLSDELKATLYPVLKRTIAGKTEAEAANILINFVQTAFDYQTDGQQFGYERPFFGDETIFYPYSDCEDRSILFSILVRELMGLDVVLLHYPGHLATAVRFTTGVNGDHLIFDNKKYIVCDPTFINANIGECMPSYKKSTCKVIVL